MENARQVSPLHPEESANQQEKGSEALNKPLLSLQEKRRKDSAGLSLSARIPLQ
jgi:hypothetical protein